MTLLQKALDLENSELASKVAELGIKVQALPFDPAALREWKAAKPELDAAWQALATEHDTTTDEIFDLLDEYYEENE